MSQCLNAGRTVLPLVFLIATQLVCSLELAGTGTGQGSVLSPATDAPLSAATVGSIDWKDSNGLVEKREGTITLGKGGDGGGTAETHCPSKCSGHGECVYAQNRYICSCALGFAGVDCSQSLCEQLNNCSGHGKCLLPTGKATLDDKNKIMEFMHKLAQSLKDPSSYTMGKPGDHGCVCEDGYSGLMCDTRTCKFDCGKDGKCNNGACECAVGFTGQKCELKACAGNCNGNGFCEAGVCKCKDGFTGVDCDKGPGGCPSKHGKDCNGNGICTEGQCMCTGLWLQPSCATLSCVSFCAGNGICNNGTCACDEGFVGDHCNHAGSSEAGQLLESNPQCLKLLELLNITTVGAADGDDKDGCIDPKCSGHGMCTGGNNCRCDNGYGGEICSKMTCPRACSGHGKCLNSGKCKCTGAYSGVACTEKTCAGGCSGHGKCIEDECHCDPMWGGELCSFRLCPGETQQCTGHGDCVEGKCNCRDGWYGEKCDLVACPSASANVTCSGHGLCQLDSEKDTPVCKCIGHWPEPYQAVKMWTGADCNSMVCADPKCSGHGKCKGGRCICDPGFRSDGCHKGGDGDGDNDEEKLCHDSIECNGGVCHESHCHCNGNSGMYGAKCHKTIIS